MDIAMILDHLIPGADWQGAFEHNTREEYDALRWHDKRAKPAWEELVAAWPEVEAKIFALENAPRPIDELRNRIEALESRTR